MRNACFFRFFVSAIMASAAHAKAPIVQPGAPGEAVKNLTPIEAVAITIPAIRPTTLLYAGHDPAPRAGSDDGRTGQRADESGRTGRDCGSE